MEMMQRILGNRDVAFAVGLAALIVGWKFMMEGLDVE